MNWIIMYTLKSGGEGQISFFSLYIMALIQYFQVLLQRAGFINVHLKFD